MANEYKIEIFKRDNNRQATKKLRKEGNIPGIYYSASSKHSIPIYISEKDYFGAIKSGARIFNISVDSKKQNVLFKSIQYHPVTEQILHIDLYGIKMDQAISIKVPLKLVGDAIGVKEEGGIINQPLNEIQILCLPSDIPELIELDITDLTLGSSLNAGEIKLDEKFKLITNEDSVIVSVTQPMQEVEPVVSTDDDETFMDDDETSQEDSSKEQTSSEELNETNKEQKSDTE